MKKISLAILTLLVALTACKKDPEVNLKYVDVERDLITVGMTTATVQCDYDYIATLKKAYFYYGEGANEADMNTAEMRVVQNTLYVDLTGLRANTTYSYFYEFHNGFNSMRTALKTFKTEASPTSVILPTVVTATVTEITANSAKGGGEVTNDGGAQVTERGICWSTHANPTLSDNHVAAGEGTGAFNAAMSNLEANTTYHVRAYAINEKGTAYGLDREFVTNGGGNSGAPEGAIDGLFSVSPTHKVFISKGNLQYQASTNTWRFAENQWDFVGSEVVYVGNPGGTIPGSSNHLISPEYEGWIDLFAWGTSGYDHGADYYQPWSATENDDDYCAYGNCNYNLNDQSGKADWGYNAISNGGNTENTWRTLTNDEWVYVLCARSTTSGIRYTKAKLEGINGVILLPDDWRSSYYGLSSINDGGASFSSNIILQSDWNIKFEANGAVFLPIAGGRYCMQVSDVGSWGWYWSATSNNLNNNVSAYCVQCNEWEVLLNGNHRRMSGRSVRLVQDYNP